MSIPRKDAKSQLFQRLIIDTLGLGRLVLAVAAF